VAVKVSHSAAGCGNRQGAGISQIKIKLLFV